MSKLFEPTSVGNIPVANRIAMAPLTRNRSPGAVPNDLNVEYYRQRATAGLIISEGTAITHQAQGYADVPGLYKPAAIEGWKKVTDAVHAAGGKIVTQIWHVGRISHTSLQPDGGAPVAPSAIAAKSKTYVLNTDGSGAFVETSEPRALETGELAGIIEDYRKAARAAVEGGFDGVEIHAANGYLLEQFMRSNSNQRSDEYGGSIENRIRLTLEVVEAVTKEIGADKTGIRISPTTPANDVSDTDPKAVYTALVEALATFDLAFVHVIEGATGGPRDILPFDWMALKAAYRNAGGKGAWIANNGYDRASAIEAVESGYADLVAFGRPFIANPDLVRRLKEDAPLNPLEPATLYGGGAEGYTTYPALA
ncbi:N-ethylmaleimide reductase [Peteryoungia aggregata LMG 23059]|uniref:N-ethylmaleimide reductase n=1 Tax=Peteryoungia aggregata LMG 23059 TaxID=1368425 RepID=A0ABU0GEF3_9HYPH|nr:alkene reductase [Peteryoungia aggregata]MDQ0423473.1 N-ethylmaleimide reductase [Peteryoungia aggregata LMG 23059]